VRYHGPNMAGRMGKYFTKSDFRMALECETQLYYAARKDEYADQHLDNSFLEALADGGFQIGALSKFLFVDDPVASKITCHDLSQDGGLAETATRMSQVNAIISEASFCYEDFFARADMIRKIESKLELYEVKAKSYNGNKSKFWKKSTHEISSE